MRPLFDARRHTRVAQRIALAYVLVFCGALGAACEDEASPPSTVVDASTEDASLSQAVCPTSAPADGSPCTLPEGTTCDFGHCGIELAKCTSGTWRFAKIPPPVCPARQPDIDEPCPACWPSDVTCIYGSEDCSAADASANTAVVACASGKWTVDIRPCRDGGADVQGDADADAD